MNENQPAPAITGRVIAIAIAAVVVLAAAVALLVARGDTPSSSGTTPAGGVAPAEFQDVTVTGTPLEQLPQSGPDPALGMPGPSLSGHSFAGFPASVTPGKDATPTMLVFLAHWCPHCNAELPRLVRWYDQGLVPDDLRVVGVVTGSRKDQPNWPPSQWIESSSWPFEVLTDSAANDAAAAYGVSGFPFMVILDESGKVVARHSGELADGEIPSFVNQALGR
jgi:cytochrome c biogenesis protein CcmG/thiol:disulfide interchange protein DsbE